MKRLTVILLLLNLTTAVMAVTIGTEGDSISWLRRTIRGFSKVDTAYVEPEHYNFSAMVQMTQTYEIYRLKSSDGQSLTFAPSVTAKVGPYFGWRWVFAGYTFDLNMGTGKSSKQEWDLSIYSAQIGVDLFYRRTGNDYKIRDVKLREGRLTETLEGLSFDGLSVGITGFNIYYIFNHQRFSYPAAFAQSGRQKRSCGSWMAGIGYIRNSLDFDHQKLQNLMSLYGGTKAEPLDSGLMFNSVRYYDISATGGYAYNWVFARNWLFCASAALGLGYKRSVGDAEQKRGFRFNNFNFDGIGRFALVYNNTRFYAGAGLVVHGYTYRKSRFSAHNAFGSLNIYVGYNFGLRSKYKKQRP